MEWIPTAIMSVLSLCCTILSSVFQSLSSRCLSQILLVPRPNKQRFEPEISDDANAGLPLMHEILKPVKAKFPDLSYADLWTLAGTQAVKLTGGPDVPFRFGRTDAPDGSSCPANGRLPDAALGAQHLREVFGRMGFGDREIVALSGAHTLGSCHRSRSGFDGPWTHNPLKVST